MKNSVTKLAALTLVLSMNSCGQQKVDTKDNLSTHMVFEQGEKITSENFNGTVYLKNLVTADSINPTAVGNVTFEPKARTKWHLHPGGQILLVIDGVGYYQEKGQTKRILRKGDVIKCRPNVPHWHGASSDMHFIQVAVTNRHHGETVWLEEVTDQVYNK
jgi:quercetin dioxygenase-like cupin family protein